MGVGITFLQVFWWDCETPVLEDGLKKNCQLYHVTSFMLFQDDARFLASQEIRKSSWTSRLISVVFITFISDSLLVYSLPPAIQA